MWRIQSLLTVLSVLGYVSGVAEAVLDCNGIDSAPSWCDPLAWPGGIVPGPGESVDCCPLPQRVPTMDCDVYLEDLRCPNPCGRGYQVMDITSGNISFGGWYAVCEESDTAEINICGDAVIGVRNDGSSARFADDGGTLYLAVGGDAVLNLGGRLRSGDGGGNIFLTFTDNAVVNAQAYVRIGDDGGGELVISGNASVSAGLGGDEGEIYLVCRKMSATADVSGNPEVYCGGDFRLGNPGQAANKAATTCDMTMSGGTINCDNFQAGWKPDKPDDFSCSMTMTGGLIIARDKLQVGEKTTVNLVSSSSGGVISCDGIEIDTGGVVDVNGDGPTDAHILIDGDVLTQVFALRDADKLTGNGSKQGLRADYGATNPGKTTVYAVVIDPNKAWDPIPRDTATKVAPEGVVLQWQNGASIGRGFHYVYFDDEPDCVTNTDCNDPAADCLVAIRKAIQPYYDLATYEDPPDSGVFPYAVLDLWTTYYWRVDESSSECWIGYVWTFTTGCELIPGDTNLDCVLNFEDYADVAGTWMQTDYWP